MGSISYYYIQLLTVSFRLPSFLFLAWCRGEGSLRTGFGFPDCRLSTLALEGVVASQHVLECCLAIVTFRLLGASLACVILVAGTPMGPAVVSSLGSVHGRVRYLLVIG